jgi:hypothetical protein
MYRSILAIAKLAVIGQHAWSQEMPKPEAPSSNPHVLDFARTNPKCTGFTDLCQTCVRAPDQSIRCSMPGIACVKQPWSCTQEQTQK